jgi:hypothetical protein
LECCFRRDTTASLLLLLQCNIVSNVYVDHDIHVNPNLVVLFLANTNGDCYGDGDCYSNADSHGNSYSYCYRNAVCNVSAISPQPIHCF